MHSDNGQSDERRRPEEGEIEVLRLIQPLKIGLIPAGGFKLISAGIDTRKKLGLLLFSDGAGRIFRLNLVPRRQGEIWESRSRYFHLLREFENHPPGSAQVLEKLTLLVRRNEAEVGEQLLGILSPESERKGSGEVRAPEMAVGNKVYLRITNACPLNCIFCNATEGLNSYYLEPEQVYAALDKAEVANLSQVVFSGGEPTLVPELPDYAARALTLGAQQIIVQTNGLPMLEPNFFDAFESMREQIGFGFSIHAFSEEANLLVTKREGVLAAQWLALERCLDGGFGAAVTFVATKPVLHEMVSFVEELHQRVAGCDKFFCLHIAYPIPNGNAWGNRELMPHFTELLTAMLPALDRAEELGLPVRMSESSCIPYCVFHSMGAAKRISMLELYGNVSEINPTERRYGTNCDSCSYKSRCPGVWHRYLDYYGDHELEPIREK